MKWLHYLLEVNCYIAVFYLGYLLLLRRETHYTLNRVYLLLTVLISFVVPVLQLGILRPSSKEVIVAIPTVVLHFTTISQPTVPLEHHFSLQDGLWYGYLAGGVISLLVLFIKLFRLAAMAKAGTPGQVVDYKLIYLKDTDTAFSFFNYLFIGTKTPPSNTIIHHELVHIRQRHSLDIIFLELLKVVNWFNPLIYFLQRSIRANHEYIADEQAVGRAMDRVAYSSFLVENAYGLNGSVLTNSFFNYNLLKRRIIMLNQTPSGNLARLKYLLIVPVSIALLCASTLAFSKDYGVIDLLPGNKVAPFATEMPVKTKRLQITMDGHTTLDVELIVKPGKHQTLRYTPENLDDAAKKYLLKTFHIKAEVVEVGNADLAKIASSVSVDSARAAALLPAHQSQHISARGYKYTEEGYLVNGKADFRVLIIQKDGTEKEYWKSKSSPAEIKMLKNIYGYTFPSMPIYSRMPPPPPAPPLINIKLSPPPPARAKGVGVIVQPSPANTKTAITSGRTVTVAIDSDAFTRAALKDKDRTPAIVVNGSIYKLKEPLKKGQQLIVSSDTTNAVMYTDEDLKQAVAKYGPAAANGVIFAHGHTSVEVK